MKAVELKVHLAQDSETRLWYVAASDVPGLRLEAESVHDLIRKVEDIAPELVELNREEIAQRLAPLGSRNGAAKEVELGGH